MYYELSLEVDVGPERVARTLADPTTWTAWQRGLIAVDALPGPAAPSRGAAWRLRFRLPGHGAEVTHRLLSADDATYHCINEAGPAWQLCENFVTSTASGTLWRQQHTWRFTGVEPGDGDLERFQITAQTTMRDLQAYVETGTRVPAPLRDDE